MYHSSPSTKPIAKEAKIVKLNKISGPSVKIQPKVFDADFSDISFLSFSQVETSSEINSTYINTSLGSMNTSRSLSDSESDVSGELLQQVFVIRDHTTQLVYGGISVKRGEFVYLIKESEYYCLIENQHGVQGIIPKDICIDLEKTVRDAKHNFKTNSKITSL